MSRLRRAALLGATMLSAGALLELGPSAHSRPASPFAEGLLRDLATLDANTHVSRYQHTTDVRPADGVYAWDCSGLVNWVLARRAPAAFRALGRPRPVARTYVEAILAGRGAWRRVDAADLEAGDVFAWRVPSGDRTGITGHVGFVTGTARRTLSLEGPAWTIPIADSTTLPHGPVDSRLRRLDLDGGLGFGELTIRPGRLGWFGPWSPGLRAREVVFGRIAVGAGDEAGVLRDPR